MSDGPGNLENCFSGLTSMMFFLVSGSEEEEEIFLVLVFFCFSVEEGSLRRFFLCLRDRPFFVLGLGSTEGDRLLSLLHSELELELSPLAKPPGSGSSAHKNNISALVCIVETQ